MLNEAMNEALSQSDDESSVVESRQYASLFRFSYVVV